MDEKEKKKRFQNLLTLLESSTRLTHLFEARIKQCKDQIIKYVIQVECIYNIYNVSHEI